jgi:AmiR/NasT family two-component response regulator
MSITISQIKKLLLEREIDAITKFEDDKIALKETISSLKTDFKEAKTLDDVSDILMDMGYDMNEAYEDIIKLIMKKAVLKAK